MNGPHIQFFGTLTRDPEQCFSQDEGIPYALLWVAVRTRYDDKQPPDTNDFEVYLWGYHMDTAVAHCRKGQQVYVFGRLSGREHHRADDTRGLAHVVNAKEFHFFPAEKGDPPEPDQGINEERPDQGYWADGTGPTVRLETAPRPRAT